MIGDKSRATYTTNAPLESGTARVVFVRPIQPLYFPGSTTAYVTNLSVLTSTPSGQSRSYVFNLVPASNPIASNGVTIDPGMALSFDPPPRLTGGVELRDVERGLRRAIARGFTLESDEIVTKVRSCINAVRAGSPLDVALLGNSLDLEVWQSLAQLGAEVRQDEFVPLEPDVPSSPTPILTPKP